MGWTDRLRQEFIVADREFAENILPVGGVDQAAFGLIADATRYHLVEERGEVHLRGATAALAEVLRSLAQTGLAVTPRDAQEAVARFAALWEEKARRRGTWEEAVAQARQDGKVETGQSRALPQPRGSLWRRLLGRRPSA